MIKKLIKKIIAKLEDQDINTLKKRGLIVGENFTMLRGSILDSSHCWLIEIGDNVTLAPNVHILAHDASTKIHLNYTKIKNVKIGNKVFIGAGTIVLPGVEIGDNVIVGAGSVVTKSIPNDTVYGGNPAKFICSMAQYKLEQEEKMSLSNTFNKDFTLGGNITKIKKQDMKKILTTERIGFVK
jgi:maltose O-acetyltransferase